MGDSKLIIAKDIFSNIMTCKKYNLFYIEENADWVIRQDALNITEALNRLGLLRAKTSTIHIGLRNKILHFGSLNTIHLCTIFGLPHDTNQLIVTMFHLLPSDKRVKLLKKIDPHTRYYHVTSRITNEQLIKLGISEERIKCIPLGINLDVFKSISAEEKKKFRRQLGLPDEVIVIGSFQKDGVGWAKGWRPKLIKGPDILVKVLQKLAQKYPIYVLLVGPARGYVERELKKSNIPFRWVGYLKRIDEVAKYYNLLDLYIITSRIEGGPKQILEAWASGIPVVSTKVGMIPDIAQDGKNVLLSDVNDLQGIIKQAKKIIHERELARELTKNALNEVREYSWEIIAKKYFYEIYDRL